MEPNDKIVACAVTVQRIAPNDHIEGYLFAGVIVGVVLIIGLVIVLIDWIDKRDRERDQELVTLRKIVKGSGLTVGTL